MFEVGQMRLGVEAAERWVDAMKGFAESLAAAVIDAYTIDKLASSWTRGYSHRRRAL